ncbi:hypothetical protein MJD09_08030, partial [bacterium]|nr:hypothetical protein [bacterium]
IVSLETVVNIMIRKGLCTPEELFEEEQRKRNYQEKVKDISLVQTDEHPLAERDKKGRRKKQSWLKRKMSQKRWSRKLATSLFGWQWKKVKHEREKSTPKEPPVVNSQ